MPPNPPSTTPIPVIGYIRVSMLQEEQISPEIQRTAIIGWARRTNRRIVRWIEDLDVSGRTFHRKIMEGVEAIERGEAREIAVWKYNRFGRNRTGGAVNLGRINLAGGELQSATEEVDARTAVGKFTRGMLMELAAFQSDLSGESWAEAQDNRRARGLPSHGRNRFGYVRRGRMRDPLQKHRTIRNPEDGIERYEPDSTVGPILAETYRRYTRGVGGRRLATGLNRAGHLGTRGHTWSDKTLMRMLDTGFGAGLLPIHDPNCECGQPGRCKNRILVPGAHLAVITEAEWLAYRRRRLRAAELPPRARVTTYPLSGRIWCGHSGARMTVTADRDRPGYWYRCGDYLRSGSCAARSVQRTRVEAAVLAGLAQWVDDLEATRGAESVQLLEPAVDVDRLKAEVAVADAAINRLTLQVAKGLVTEDAYKTAHDELLADRAKAALELEELEKPPPMEPYEYIPVIEATLEEWDTLAGEQRRELLAELITAVRVFREDRMTSWIVIESAWGQSRTVDLPFR